LGEHELAASQIVRSVYGIMGILVWALANTTNSMVSNLYGQSSYQEILPLISKVVRISLLYTIGISLVLFLFAQSFIAVYTSNEIIRALSQPTLYVVLLASIIFSISTIYFNALLGLGNTKRNLVYELIAITAYLIYCYIVIEQLRSPLWIAWCAEFIYWGIMLVLSAQFMHSKSWQKKL
jgi:Na+-driven multidrug efflux pump